MNLMIEYATKVLNLLPFEFVTVDEAAMLGTMVEDFEIFLHKVVPRNWLEIELNQDPGQSVGGEDFR